MIKSGCLEDSKDVRHEVLKNLFDGDRNLTDFKMSLVYQMFTTSCQIEESYLTLSIQELIFIYNFIIYNFDEVCLEPDGNSDPLRLLMQEL